MEHRTISRIKSFALWLFVIAVVFAYGCAANTTTKVTKIYTATAQTVNAVHDAIDNACNTGLATPDQCIRLKADYNKAATAYKSAGDTLAQINILSETINSNIDAAQKTDAQGKLALLNEQYPTLIGQASNFINSLIQTLQATGVNIKL